MSISGIIVKTSGRVPDATLAINAATVPFTARPLFSSIGGDRRDPAVAPGGTPGAGWFLLSLKQPEAPPLKERISPWDLCHTLLQQGFGVAGAPAIEFAEPDLEQRWLTASEADLGLKLGATCGPADPQDAHFPGDSKNPFWHRNLAHSQFDAALAKLGGAGIPSKVRIAHLDTGYDPTHKSIPTRLNRNLARNFVERDANGAPTKDAAERASALGNRGHGTGTLGILAGRAIGNDPPVGAAPFAEVVPIRVANWVVLFYTSAIAEAFDYVHRLANNPAERIDIVTMSMGGLASQAWAEAVNALYDAGVFIVTAAGNNFANLPTRHIVYPARFDRVVAACGVMADGKPYADLPYRLMAGNYGPPQKMTTAIAACTPNIPWARIGCPEVVDLDGAGTSSATPQVAAAAALWVQLNREALDHYPEPWMRVEAIRTALFDAAQATDTVHFGRGTLRAHDALDRAPAVAAALKKQRPDTAAFPFLRTLTGLGISAVPDARQHMLELEALQLSQALAVENVLPDPDVPADGLDRTARRRLAEALASQPGASHALKSILTEVAKETLATTSEPRCANPDSVAALHLDHALRPKVPAPACRPLRVYAYDPSLGTDLATLDINETILDVRWEDNLKPGPVGEYIEVVDIDPASQRCYAPIDLNDPNLLTQAGLPPSEANPQFHQQMAYAVAMKTIDYFEHALGRTALWAPRQIRNEKGEVIDETYVQRLRIYPHALRTENAYYSPDRKALLLGYFKARDSHTGSVLPGGVVFTAVSHDIIAHETTHALLDGLHLRFREPTNKDVLAFHEAFADIVALFQHFTLPAALRDQIRKTRGELDKNNLLAKLAVQFGEATNRGGALRDAIGKVTDGKWKPAEVKADAYQSVTEAHELGAVLVAAVFDAFLQIYERRTEDLIRLATGGTGVLPKGAIPADLVDRQAEEASKVARQVLTMCIRALDYCPPVDLTFGEYLRAIITADADLVPDDRLGYRTAFIAAFRDRGIFPGDVKHLATGSLLWEAPPLPLRAEKVRLVLQKISLAWNEGAGRKAAYDANRKNRLVFHAWLMDPENVSDAEIDALGLVRIAEPQSYNVCGVDGELRVIEIHSIRPARRVAPDGRLRSDLVVEITQTFRPADRPDVRYRGGCTLLINLSTAEVRFLIRKKVQNMTRYKRQMEFADDVQFSPQVNYFGRHSVTDEPFALLHRARGAQCQPAGGRA